MHIMTKEAAEKYLAEYRKSIAPYTGIFHHWATPEQEAEYLQQVKDALLNGAEF